MGRLTSLFLLLVIGASTSSCGFINNLFNRGDETEVTEEEAPSDAATAPEDGTAAVPTEGDEELFQESMLPGLPSAAEIALAELLPSTDPNERLKEIEKDRPDPYAYVPVPPPVTAAPPAPPDTPTAGGPGDGASPSPNGGGAGGQQPGTAGGGQGQPGPDTSPTPIQPLPTLPEPTVVASQVEVSGVAQINGKTYAIVKAPGEPTSRYVKPGDRLSNGTILVKRIETRSGQDPMVVLEERGIEIALPVGAGSGTGEESTAVQPSNDTLDIASLPVLPLLP